jgi:predicted outer membrane repeat protein
MRLVCVLPCVLAGGVLVATPPAPGGSARYVDDDAGPGGDGASWATAYRHLSDALAEAAGAGGAVDEIRVGQGTYAPDRSAAVPGGTGDRDATFALVDGVAVRGGFAGVGAVDPDDRDPLAYETILSGDLAGDDETGGGTSENSRHVVTARLTSPTAVLDGVTVRDGNTTGALEGGGGGVLVIEASPTIRGCVITDNEAPTTVGSGAGVMTQYGGLRLERCVLSDNSATSDTSVAFGGGALYVFGGSATLVECTLTGNAAGRGGAIFASGDVRLERCVLSSNTASRGGALYRERKSGLSNDVLVSQTAFASNVAASRGGAIESVTGSSGTVLTNCRFVSNEARAFGGGALRDATADVLVGNTLFAGNTSGGSGGAVETLGASPRFVNCTFVSNVAAWKGGAVYVNSTEAAPVIRNGIFWGSTSGQAGGGEQGQIDRFGSSPLPSVSYSVVEGLTGALGGVGNTDANPQFANPHGPDGVPDTFGDNDYGLSPGSPAIDAGHNWGVLADVADLDGDGDTTECSPLDLSGAPRFADDAAVADVGCGAPVVVEMGAYERAGTTADPVVPGDVNGDARVDFDDLLRLLADWGPADECMLADLDLDAFIGPDDLVHLLESWRD